MKAISQSASYVIRNRGGIVYVTKRQKNHSKSKMNMISIFVTCLGDQWPNAKISDHCFGKNYQFATMGQSVEKPRTFNLSRGHKFTWLPPRLLHRLSFCRISPVSNVTVGHSVMNLSSSSNIDRAKFQSTLGKVDRMDIYRASRAIFVSTSRM